MTKSKWKWNFSNVRKNTSLIVIAMLSVLAVASSAFYYLDAYRQRITLNSRAATDSSGQCQTTTAHLVDKCTQGLFSREVCQFIRDGSGKTPWNYFTISGNPNISAIDYGNDGGEASSLKFESKDGKPFSAGAYYTFPTTPGKTYCASWRWGPNTNTPGKPNAFGRTIGLDPSGGTDPNANTVQWGNTETRVARHLDYSLLDVPTDPNLDTKIKATGNSMTIFLKGDYNASEGSFLLMDMVNVYDEGGAAVPPTPTPTFNPVGNVSCPTTSSNNYISAPIATAESVGDRVPAEFHPDKNLLVRGYIQNDNNTKQVIDYSDPNRDTSAPQFTTLTDNAQPAIFHTYQVYDWNWGTPPNWGNKGALLIANPPTSYGVTAIGLYGNPGSRVYVPNSGYTVNGGHQAYVIYASQNPTTSMGTMTLLYLSEDRVSGGYAVQLDNFCIDPKLLALYQQLSPPNKTNRNQLPVLDGKQPIGTFKTNELVVAIKDKGTYMDPRSIAWWQGVTALPPQPTAPPSTCPVPDDTSGLQAVRNGNNINLAWNPNPSATKYTLWVDVKNKADGSPDPWDGTCTSPAGDFCVDLVGSNSSTYTFAANQNQAYEWSIHAFNSCGQVKAQQGPYVAAVVNVPTATPTSALPPGCLPINAPAGRDLVWSCVIGSIATASLTWQPVANATTYTLQIDDMSDTNPWDGSCTSPAGDTCIDTAATSYSFEMRPGHTYAWNVQPKSGCTVGPRTSGATFRCAIPTSIFTPTPLPPTGLPTATPTPANPPTNTPSPTPTPTETPTPAPRFADCNKCGYCSTKTKQPGNYKECMKCLYPNMTEQDTLKVDPLKNQPPAPATGKYFSQLGCIDVGAAGFKDPSAAGGVVNVILNRLFFPITGVLALLSLIYGSFLLITGQDNPEQIARGKGWIYGGIIGVVFTFSAILIIRLIASDILKIPGFNM